MKWFICLVLFSFSLMGFGTSSFKASTDIKKVEVKKSVSAEVVICENSGFVEPIVFASKSSYSQDLQLVIRPVTFENIELSTAYFAYKKGKDTRMRNKYSNRYSNKFSHYQIVAHRPAHIYL